MYEQTGAENIPICRVSSDERQEIDDSDIMSTRPALSQEGVASSAEAFRAMESLRYTRHLMSIVAIRVLDRQNADRINCADVRDQLELLTGERKSRRTANNSMRHLVEQGLVEKRGKRNPSYDWRLTYDGEQLAEDLHLDRLAEKVVREFSA